MNKQYKSEIVFLNNPASFKEVSKIIVKHDLPRVYHIDSILLENKSYFFNDMSIEGCKQFINENINFANKLTIVTDIFNVGNIMKYLEYISTFGNNKTIKACLVEDGDIEYLSVNEWKNCILEKHGIEV